MNKSQVFYTNLRCSPNGNLLVKTVRLAKRAGILNIDFNNKFTAIKLHFGEPGNVSYIRPNYVAKIVDLLKENGAFVYLTDSNTLYSGKRSNAVDHLNAAIDNGFNPLSAHANVIIADGVKGTDFREIELNGQYCKAPKIGSAIADADIIISMTHFKGHEAAGFGGTIKNLGMGSASVSGKLELHSDVKPVVHKNLCTGCGVCAKNCAHDAIHVIDRKAEIDYNKCVGCGQCIALCQFGGVGSENNISSEVMNCKIAEYAKAVLQDKPQFHISFIMNVSPECDCWGHNDAAVIPDLGILASFDPIALDQACVDLVTKAPILQTDNCLSHKHPHQEMVGKDKFRLIHPDTRWEAGLEHGEKIGLGTRNYELIEI